MINKVFKYWRISFTAFFMMALMGVSSWLTMPREEDPKLKDRSGIVQVFYPGATAEEVYRLITKPIEDKFASIDEIKRLNSSSSPEISFIEIELKENISSDTELNKIWDEITKSLDDAKVKFPEGVYPPIVERDLLDQEAIVLSLTGADNLGQQMDLLRSLEDRLIQTPLVARVTRHADPGEVIRIKVDEDQLNRLGIDMLYLSDKLSKANNSISSGTIDYNSKKMTIKTNASFQSVEDISNYSISLSSGEVITLSSIAKVEKGYQLPRERGFRYNGVEGLSLGIIPQSKIDLIKFGENVKETVEKFKTKHTNLQIDIVSFQPDNVAFRINDLVQSLLTGLIFIGLVLSIAMGFRISLLASMLVPAITLVGLGIFHNTAGGILHQISIAAFVIALGLLVDNVIVVLESIQNYIDNGMSKLDSASKAVKDLALPLTAATGTTVSAFVPMLGSGNTADFVKAIPIVVLITLLVSYFAALIITPVFGSRLLKAGTVRNWDKANSYFYKIGEFVSRHPKKIAGVVLSLSVLSFYFFGNVKMKFFPSADRNQLVVEIQLVEGTNFKTTDNLVKRIESFLRDKTEITDTAVYVGQGTPIFFYNLARVPSSPHVSQIITLFDSAKSAREMRTSLQEELDKKFPEASILVRSLAQGTPIRAPVEYIITGDNLSDLVKASEDLVRKVRLVDGSMKVRSTAGAGNPVLNVKINDANATKYNLERSIVGASIYARTRGIDVGSFRYGSESFPVNLASSKLESIRISNVGEIDVSQTRTESVKLDKLSNLKLDWEPSIINSYNKRLAIRVLSEVKDNYDIYSIINEIDPQIDAISDKYNVVIEQGGEVAESENSNAQILQLLPVGLMLLLISLLLQFNSFSKVIVVFGSLVPMFIGIVPGLILTNQYFSFFSILAMLSLIGIAINNGILIVDQIDNSIDEGLSKEKAMAESVKRRLRPIMLTTATTVLGLLPLAFSSSTLWPPFALTMIFGLLASMIFTPLLVPSLYGALVKVDGNNRLGGAEVSKVMIVGMVFLGSLFSTSSDLMAQPIGLYEIRETIEKHPSLDSQKAQVNYAEVDKKRIKMQGVLPSVSAEYQKLRLDREIELQTPIGNLGGFGRSQTTARLLISQPIYNPGKLGAEKKAAGLAVEEQKLLSSIMFDRLFGDAIVAYTDYAQYMMAVNATKKFIKSLKLQKDEVKRLLDLGKVTKVDLLKIKLEVSKQETNLSKYISDLDSARNKFAYKLGLNDPVDVVLLDNPELVFRVLVKDKSIAMKDRLGIKVYNKKLDSLDMQVKAINESYLPKVDLIGSVQHEDPSIFNEQTIGAFGVSVTWNIFGSNQRSYEKQKIIASKRATVFEKRNLENEISNNESYYNNQINKIKLQWSQNVKDLKEAKNVVRSEKKRYSKGKSTLSDLIEAELLVQELEISIALAPYQLLSAWAGYSANNGKIEIPNGLK